MLKRNCFIKFILIIAIFCVTLSGCSYSNSHLSSNFYYSFTDSVGNDVVLTQKPQKVAVLFSSFAEVWTLSGGMVSVTVGESIERGFVDEDTALVDSSAGKIINNELLISLKPDFVICSADIPSHIDTAALLTRANIPCAIFCVDCFEDYLEMLKICTDITEDSIAYQTYGINVKDQIDKIIEKVKDIKQQKNILFIRSGSTSSSAKAKTSKEHFAAAMLEQLGAKNIADNVPILLDGLSIEEIIEEDPSYIFISTMGDEDAAKNYMNSVLSHNVWQQLTAVQNENFEYLPKDMFHFKPNARWADAYEYLAKRLYPEHFADE